MEAILKGPLSHPLHQWALEVLGIHFTNLAVPPLDPLCSRHRAGLCCVLLGHWLSNYKGHPKERQSCLRVHLLPIDFSVQEAKQRYFPLPSAIHATELTQLILPRASCPTIFFFYCWDSFHLFLNKESILQGRQNSVWAAILTYFKGNNGFLKQ